MDKDNKELYPGFEDLEDEEREISIIDWILANDGTFNHSWYITGKVNRVFYETLLPKYSDIFDTWNRVLELQETKDALPYPHRLSLSMEMGVIKLSLEYISDVTGEIIRDSYAEIDVEKDFELLYAIVDALYYSQGDMYTEIDENPDGSVYEVTRYYAF